VSLALAPQSRGTVNGGQIRHALSDSAVLTKRNLITMPRMLDVVVFAAVQPVMFVLLFAYVFGGAIRLPGGGHYREFLIAGVLVQAVAFAGTRTAVGVCTDMHKGMVDRFRSLPIARSAVLIARTASDAVLNVFTIAVTAAVGLAIGWRIHRDFGLALAGFALLLLFAYALSWVGAAIGLSTKNQEAATQAMLTWVFPLAFISEAFVPPQGMPHWMQYIAEWNPITAIVNSCRQLWGNPQLPPPHRDWVTGHPVEMALIWSVAVLAIAVPLAARQYRKAAAY
jgi:ABC transporter DrrB family efflux protein